jgi:hypothetical protein
LEANQCFQIGIEEIQKDLEKYIKDNYKHVWFLEEAHKEDMLGLVALKNQCV